MSHTYGWLIFAVILDAIVMTVVVVMVRRWQKRWLADTEKEIHLMMEYLDKMCDDDDGTERTDGTQDGTD